MRRGLLNKVFGQSPFGAIQHQMTQVMNCVGQLVPLYEAVVAGQQEAIAAVVAQIDALEEAADVAKNAIRDHLPRQLLLPVDRRDLLELVHHLDSMADSLQEAAGLLVLRPMRLPADLAEIALAFARDVAGVASQAAEILDHLDELLEATFGGPEAEQVLAMIDQLDAGETKSELLCREMIRSLFASQGQLTDLEIMLWREILTHTANIANYAERAGNRLRLLIAKV